MGRPKKVSCDALRTSEKTEESIGRQLMDALGFTCWHLSQSRATNQTPGWPDMLFTHPDKKIALWWEAKSPTGKQSPAQQQFQHHVSLCGYTYLCGPSEVLVEWARGQKLIR